MPHKVFVVVTQNVVVIGAVLREVEIGVFEDGDQVGKPFDPFVALAELVRIVEVRKIGAGQSFVGLDKRLNDPRVDQIADVRIPLERHHVLEACALRNGDRRLKIVTVTILVRDVLDEQHEQDVVLVLAGIHAAAEFVTGGPERRIEIRFLDCHDSWFPRRDPHVSATWRLAG
jgi:hypothetical protein